MEPQENRNCYASIEQRQLLIELAKISSDFLLTGGTALSVFYLHHRISEDIDLFSRKKGSVRNLKEEVRRRWTNIYVIKETDTFFSAKIENVKIDIVESQPESKTNRPIINLDDVALEIDNLHNIATNKLTTLLSRSDPKDFIDFHYLIALGEFNYKKILQGAIKKDGSFDDTANAAYYIESNMKLVKRRTDWPEMLLQVEKSEIFKTAESYIKWLYDYSRQDFKDKFSSILWLSTPSISVNLTHYEQKLKLSKIKSSNFSRKNDFRLTLNLIGELKDNFLPVIGEAIPLGTVEKGKDLPIFRGQNQNHIFKFEYAQQINADYNIPKKLGIINFEPHTVKIKQNNISSQSAFTIIYFLNGFDYNSFKYDGYLKIRPGNNENYEMIQTSTRVDRNATYIGPQVISFKFKNSQLFFGRIAPNVTGTIPGSFLIISENVKEVRKTGFNFSKFINFIMGSSVTPIGCRKYDIELNVIEEEYWNVNREWELVAQYQLLPLLPLGFRHHVEQKIDFNLSKVIEKLYTSYNKLKEKFSLNQIFWYINESKYLPFELQIHPLSTALDLLTKAWFASSKSDSKGKYFDDEKYSKIVEPIIAELEKILSEEKTKDGILKRIENANNISYSQRTPVFLEELSLILSDTEKYLLKKLRNIAIHGSTKPYDSQDRFLQTRGFLSFIGRIILKLLEYDELYIDYSSLNFPARHVGEGVRFDRGIE